MKNLKFIMLLLAVILVLPLCVFAEEESTEKKSEVNIYFFRGEGCSHCAETEEWFKEIEEEHGSKFKIVDYETWNNEDNADLMKKVAKARDEEDQATGVPYIIIGDKSWIGFTDEYKDEILEQIDKVYEQDDSERYDIMKLLGENNSKKEDKSSDVGALIIILLAVGALGFGIYKARTSAK